MIRTDTLITGIILLLAGTLSYAEVTLEGMVITAEPEADNRLSDDIQRSMGGSTLGAALSNEPGIVNQSFGPGVGRPVIRGQSGRRVRILQNSLGVSDLSSISPDHGVALEPLLAGNIELLQGPSTLRYASGQLGGVINVHNGRIPESLPVRPLEFIGQYRFDSTNLEHAGIARIDAGWGPLALHLDGLRRTSDDLHTGNGVLDHTGGNSRSGSAGISWIGKMGFFGGAVNRLENKYGVPTFDGAKVDIDLKKTRYDLRSEWFDPLPGADSLRLAFGHTDYRHVEIENGQRGTLWTRRSNASRVELTQRPVGGLTGSWGFQSLHSQLAAIGEEAIVPRTDTTNYAGFINETLEWGAFAYEAGLRVEHQTTKAEDRSRRHDLPVSGALSASWHPNDRHRISLAFTSTQRAPQPEELFSFGVHTATQSFEIGNPNLKMEHSHQLELRYRFERDRFLAEISLFHYWVNDYIFFGATETTDPESGLPIFSARQVDGRFIGFEAQLNLPLLTIGGGDLDLNIFGDLTRGRLDRGGDVPRMPPLRYGLALNYQRETGNLFLRLTRAEPQNHPGQLEASTPGFVLLNIGGEYDITLHRQAHLIFFVQGTNLLDQTIRNSTSFLRTIGPEPGRGVQTGVRIEYR